MIAGRDAVTATSMLRPVLLLMSGRTVGLVAAFAIPVALARIFDPTDFGTYKQLFLVAATLYGVGQLGMAESLFYFVPRAPADAARYVANATLALAAGGIACLIGLAWGGPALAHWLGNPAVAQHTTALGVYMLLMLVPAALEIVMTARKQYRQAASAYAVFDVLRAACLVVPALLVPDLHWLMAGAIVFVLLRSAVTAGYLRREFDGALVPSGELFRHQLAYALPFQLAGIVEIAQSSLHQYAVAMRFDPATFAVYAVGCLQVPLVEVAITSVVNVMMVRMAEELTDGRPEAAAAVWHDSTRKLALVFFPLAGALAVLAHPIIVLLFTERYAASVPVFVVSLVGLLWPVMAVDGVLRVYAATRTLFALNLVRLGLTVALLAWLVGALGLVGAMLATVLAIGLSRALGLVQIGRLMDLPLSRLLPWGGLARILAAAAVAAVPAWAVRAVLDGPFSTLLVAGPVYAAAYAIALRALHALDDDEWAAIRGALERFGAAPRSIRTPEVDEPCVESRD